MKLYRTEIDGLRAIAVLLVVAFHLEASPVGRGGFVGVDVFFVLSGFLITGHLRSDVQKGLGGILDFYHRRANRILPALFATYLACAAVELLLRFPAQIHGFKSALLSSDLFVSNIYLYNTVGYFDFAARNNALIHTWSLSIEEQFYILLPILLLLIRKMPANRQLIIICGMAAVSLLGAELALAHNGRAAFYWVNWRAWELLAGSILSYRKWDIFKRAFAAEAASVAGLVMIAGSALYYSQRTQFPGLHALVPVMGTMLVLAGTEQTGTRVKRLLSLPPVAFFGKISYSLYLWHWPIIVYGRYIHPANGLIDKAALVVVSIALASLSWALIEQPSRDWGRRIGRAPALSVAAASIIFVALVSLALEPLSRTIWPANPAADRMLTAMNDYDPAPVSRSGTCFLEGARGKLNIPLCLTPRANSRNVLILGDSHAAHLWYGLARRYPDVNFMQATVGSCLPLYVKDKRVCGATMRLVMHSFLKKNRPDAIILSARWVEPNLRRLPGLLKTLKASTPNLIIIGPSPEYALPLPEVAARSIYAGKPQVVSSYLDTERLKQDKPLERIVTQAGGRYVSPARLLCQATCTVLTPTGNPIMFDNDHLTAEGSMLLVSRFPPDLLKPAR